MFDSFTAARSLHVLHEDGRSSIPSAAGAGARPVSRLQVRSGAKLQWHKLREAWRLMEAAEVRAGATYDLVLELRW